MVVTGVFRRLQLHHMAPVEDLRRLYCSANDAAGGGSQVFSVDFPGTMFYFLALAIGSSISLVLVVAEKLNLDRVFSRLFFAVLK